MVKGKMSGDVKMKVEHFRRTMKKKLPQSQVPKSEVPKNEVGKKCTKVKKCPKAKCPEVPKSKGAKTHFPKVKKEPGAGAQQAHGGLVGIAAVMGRPPIQTPGGVPHKKRILPKVKKPG